MHHGSKGVSPVTPEAEVMALLARVFPSLQQLPPAEQAARADALGLLLAQGWAVGAAGLKQRGLEVPENVVLALATVAPRVVQARRGGTTFLAHVRQGLGDDAAFQRLALALGTLFARTRTPAAGTASGRFPAVTAPGATPSGSFPALGAPGNLGSGAYPTLNPAARTAGRATPAPPPAPPPPPTPAPAPATKLTTSRPTFTALDAAAEPEPLGEVDAPAPPPPAAKRPAQKTRSQDELDELDGLMASKETAREASRERTTGEPPRGDGERTGGFDASMLSDLDSSIARTSRSPKQEAPAHANAERPAAAELIDLEPLEGHSPSAPPAEAAAGDDFLSSLVGGGLAPDAPAPAPPPARAAAPPPPPRPASAPSAGKASSAFEQALAAGGGLDFKDDEPAPPPAPPPPRQAPPARPTPKPAAPPPPASDALDLLPEEPRKNDADDAEASLDRLLQSTELAPPPPPKAEKERRPSGRFKTATNVRIQEFSLDSTDEPTPKQKREDEAEEEEAVEELPKDPAQAAVVRYERTGDPTALTEARRLFSETVSSAPHGTARAFAEAGLAKVQLLAGNVQAAEAQARAALERDPGNPFAVEVLARAARGEAERARLAAGLAQGRTHIANGRGADARRHLERVAQVIPDAPQPWLMLALLSKIEGDDARFEAALAQAWQRYPGKKQGDVPLGATFDVDLAALVAGHGRQKFKNLDPDFLRQTIEGIDDKANMVAGTFRLAIACARVGMARGHPSRKLMRKAWGAIAAALVGLQHYDQAVEACDKAMALHPDEGEARALDQERRFAGQMRRSFDKPGVKAQLGKYKCLGVQALSEATQARLAFALKDKQVRDAELQKAASEIAAFCLGDGRAREEIAAAARALGKADPLEPVVLATAELQAVKDERARLADPTKPAAPEKKGLFSKLAGAASAAADKVATAAKDTQLKIRESQLQSKRDEAVKKLGLAIARELRDHRWSVDALKAFARRAATLEAFSDFNAEEERQSKAELDGLARSV
jgi:tetratricopeptide (TPR) repeat protein